MTQVFDRKGPAALEGELARILARSVGDVAENIRVSVQGPRVILRGTAPSYAEKAQAEQSLRSAGCHEVDNCLRVVPTLTIVS